SRECSRRRPHAFVDAAPSAQGESCDAARARQMRVAMTERKLNQHEALDERTQGRVRHTFENPRQIDAGLTTHESGSRLPIAGRSILRVAAARPRSEHL